jgi:hypothetical protein
MFDVGLKVASVIEPGQIVRWDEL